ncbi:MAG: MoaD/ThiS family protein [Thermoplasmata archaeon]|jgi:sulfur carrier protein ThiS|nr:MoaD/ThiS family protein [Thermoplasmata archaeon]
MKVKLLPDNKEIDSDFRGKVEDLVRHLNLKPDEVVALKGKKPVPIDHEISDSDEITIIRVASGG